MVAEKNGVSLKKTFSIENNSYVVNVTHELTNVSTNVVKAGLYYQLSRDSEPPQEEVAFTILIPDLQLYTETGKFQKIPFEDIEESKQEHVEVSKNGWFGIIQHYYVGAWLFRNSFEREFYTNKLKNNTYSIGAIQLSEELRPNQTQKFENILYVGPQYQEDLKNKKKD